LPIFILAHKGLTDWTHPSYRLIRINRNWLNRVFKQSEVGLGVETVVKSGLRFWDRFSTETDWCPALLIIMQQKFIKKCIPAIDLQTLDPNRLSSRMWNKNPPLQPHDLGSTTMSLRACWSLVSRITSLSYISSTVNMSVSLALTPEYFQIMHSVKNIELNPKITMKS